MSTVLCYGNCGAVLPTDVLMCRACRGQLMTDVRSANDLLRDLDVTLSRQDRVAPPRIGGRSASTPLPFHPSAGKAARELRASIRGLAAAPVLTRPDVARFRAARDHARNVIDLPDPHMFIGQCECGTALHARTGERTVECRTPGCGRVWDAERADGAAAFSRLAGSMPRIRRWLLALGVTRSRAQLYRDVAGLTAVGHDDHGRVYRLADVWDRVTHARTSKGA